MISTSIKFRIALCGTVLAFAAVYASAITTGSEAPMPQNPHLTSSALSIPINPLPPFPPGHSSLVATLPGLPLPPFPPGHKEFVA